MIRYCSNDIAIIPCDLRYDWDMAKSANRLTLFMALGMPVVASPVPAYCEIANQRMDAIIARSPREWRGAINWLSDAENREKMGQSARRSVWPHYSPENTAKKYIEVFQ